MANCLVTRLKGVVDSDAATNLEKIGELKLHITPFDSSINNSFIFEFTKDTVIDFGEGGYSLSNDSNFTNKELIVGTTLKTVYIDRSKDYYITIKDKYSLVEMYYYAPITLDFSKLAYSTELFSIHGKALGNTIVNLSEDFKYLTNLLSMFWVDPDNKVWDLDELPDNYVFGSTSSSSKTSVEFVVYINDASNFSEKIKVSIKKAKELFSKHKIDPAYRIRFKDAIDITDWEEVCIVSASSTNKTNFIASEEKTTGTIESLVNALRVKYEDYVFRINIISPNNSVTFNGDLMPVNTQITITYTDSTIKVSYGSYTKEINA